MTFELRPMTGDEAMSWFPKEMEDYVLERVRAGEDLEVTRKMVQEQSAEFAPGGVPAPSNHFFWQVDDDEVVGALWLGAPIPRAQSTWYVSFVVVEENFQGRGYGRAAMQAAEAFAKEQGGAYLGLNVFGHNPVARRLYDSLGYQAMATTMRKVLA